MGSLPCSVLTAGVKESTGIVRDSSVRGIGTDPEAWSAVCVVQSAVPHTA